MTDIERRLLKTMDVFAERNDDYLMADPDPLSYRFINLRPDTALNWIRDFQTPEQQREGPLPMFRGRY